MKKAGQVALFRFPHTNLIQGKPRPALLIGRLPGQYDDWLMCMISSQTRHHIQGFDETIQEGDADFNTSGLKMVSVIRIGRLTIVEEGVLLGAIGEIAPDRLQRIKSRLADWLMQS